MTPKEKDKKIKLIIKLVSIFISLVAFFISLKPINNMFILLLELMQQLPRNETNSILLVCLGIYMWISFIKLLFYLKLKVWKALEE